MKDSQDKVFLFGPFRMNVSQRALWCQGEPVSLTPKEFDTLLVLVEASGQLVGKETIVSRVWPDTFVADSSLTRNVSVLRRALGDDVIETVPKFGYRLTLAVTPSPAAPSPLLGADPAAPAPAPVDPSAAAGETPSRLRRRWLGMTAAAALLALGAYLAWPRFFPPSPTHAGRSMLVVLPFQNLSGDPSQEYLGDGLTDELTTELARLSPERLGVIAETSATAYKHANKRVDQIAKELGVNYVLEGGVVRSGDRVRVNAQLIDASDQSHVWAESYDRNAGDVLEVESEIATAVASAVQLKLTHQQTAQLASKRPINVEAHEAYLLGRYYWNQRTPAGYEKAEKYFGRAVEKDPQYAAAYAGLAESFGLSLPERKAAAMKAVELDPTSGEAHTALAGVRLYGELDLPRAEAELKRAIQLDPNYATAHHWYAGVLEARGDLQQAIAELRQAERLDPLSLIIKGALADTLSFAGQNDAAVTELQKAFAMDPHFPKAHLTLGIIHLRRAMYPEAIREFQTSLEHGGVRPELMSLFGYAYARSGNRAQALKMLGDIQELKRQGTAVEPSELAVIEIGLGNADQALAWLEKGYDQRDDGLLRLKVDPMFEPLRSDPRFQDLERRVGLPL
jgi:TolB-like protein/DNA-binding winged helix-turn-helix (wHTH) protein/Flp pilus assembly protein TadD